MDTFLIGLFSLFIVSFLADLGSGPNKSTISEWEYRVQKCKEVHIPECDKWFKK